MCHECETIDRLILKYRQTRETSDDDLLAEVIADLESEKVALHPDDKQSVG